MHELEERCVEALVHKHDIPRARGSWNSIGLVRTHQMQPLRPNRTPPSELPRGEPQDASGWKPPPRATQDVPSIPPHLLITGDPCRDPAHAAPGTRRKQGGGGAAYTPPPHPHDQEDRGIPCGSRADHSVRGAVMAAAVKTVVSFDRGLASDGYSDLRTLRMSQH